VAAAIGLSILHQVQQDSRATRAREGVHADAAVASVAKTRGEDPKTVVTYRYATPCTTREHTIRRFAEAEPFRGRSAPYGA